MFKSCLTGKKCKLQQCCSIIISNSSGNNTSSSNSRDSSNLYIISKSKYIYRYTSLKHTRSVLLPVCVVSFSLLFLYHEWTGCERETFPQVAALDPNVVCTASVDLSALCQHPLHLSPTPAPCCIYLCSILAGMGYIYNRFVNAIFFDFLATFQLTF